MKRTTITRWDGDWMTVEVPTEDGRICIIEFGADYEAQKWHVQISDSLMRTSPEVITAALGLAIQALQHIDGDR